MGGTNTSAAEINTLPSYCPLFVINQHILVVLYAKQLVSGLAAH